MLSTKNEKISLNLVTCIDENTNQILKNGNIRHFWTNFGHSWTNYDKKTNNQENCLVSYNNLVENINEAKVNPYKLQEQCYINDTTKVALGLSANEMVVLGALYGVTHDSGVGYLTNEYISNATRLSISSIKNYLRKFENLGLIERKYERNGMKVTRNYSFTEIFFKVSELSGNKCIKRPEAKPEVNECQNLHKMATKPIGTHGQNLSINNTSINIDNNIPKSILLSNKVNISINTYNKVNTEYSEIKTKVDKKQRTKSTSRNKLVSYNEMIDNFVDLNYKEGQRELKEVLRKRLQVIYGTRRNRKTKLKLTNKELKATLDKLLKLSKGNAGKALTIVQYSNTQYYSDIYEPNLKTCIAYKDKAYSNIIKRVDSINSTLSDNDPRYEENLTLKYKALNKLSLWTKVRENLLPMMRPIYDGTHHFEEVDNMLYEFTKVNNEKQWTFGMAEQNQKIGDRANCQGVGVPLYNLNGSQKIDFVSHCLDHDNLEPNKGVESYGHPKAKYDSNPTYDLDSYDSHGPTYDIDRYESYNFLDHINNEEDEGLCAYDTCAYNPESTKELIYNEKQDTDKKSKLDVENIETPPPICAAPPSPLGREYVIRPKLSDLKGVNEEKCKSIPPGDKQALNGLKTAQNEKCEKYEEPDPEFVKKCLEIAKANLMRKDE